MHRLLKIEWDAERAVDDLRIVEHEAPHPPAGRRVEGLVRRAAWISATVRRLVFTP